ncbi:MAG: class I SAM-dependent methyltransferase [Candidatus Omnitrophica bacterium]|nr:class I SAM-dependent methyltransferase [Candidatus Omnitrophota bacterium]
MDSANLKKKVVEFWDGKSCGEAYAAGDFQSRDYYESHSAARYQLENYIAEFARFEEGSGKAVLEIGVGMGADHREWARSGPQLLLGTDITPRAAQHTRRRFDLSGLTARVAVSDAEDLPFRDEVFDLVYSWGVLHHTPDTPKAIREIWRVLKPGGTARVMIYHKFSLTGFLLWLRYGLLSGRFFITLEDLYSRYLESPGTKAYSVREAREMFAPFREVSAQTRLSFGDLLEGAVGQRHRGFLLTLAKKIWPRFLLKIFFRKNGLLLLIEAKK